MLSNNRKRKRHKSSACQAKILTYRVPGLIYEFHLQEDNAYFRDKFGQLTCDIYDTQTLITNKLKLYIHKSKHDP